ncbi:DedA family protein [Pseudonocardia sp. GCM10023141]|uniref:DedA family protein n=1 Tax=Pseudonocardia sp. GCM10023141 TaxID=3252653 RepID=UPI00360A2425
MSVDHLLQAIPPLLVYLIVGGVVGLESLGIPLPGEIVLVSAALLSSRHELDVSPVWIGVAAIAGAVIGDSIGYFIGRRYGRPLFDWLGRKLPKHFGPTQVNFAEHVFTRWGVYAVFFGRFIALLRIFAGPLAGALKMPYPKFLAANVLGGICWAGGTTAAVYFLGIVAEKWLSRFSYIGLGAAVVVGLTIGFLIKRKTHKLAEQYAKEDGIDGVVAQEVAHDIAEEIAKEQAHEEPTATSRNKAPETA